MGEITIETPDGPMGAAVAEPDGTPKGAVVVVQEAFGLTSHIIDVTRRVADAGYLAVAPALFHRQGSPVFAYDDFASLGPVFQSLSGEQMLADVDATLTWAAQQGFAENQTGIVGFCMGGTVALMAATRHELGAAVTFYGGGVGEGRFGFPSLVEAAPKLRSPWLGLYGDLDKGIPVEEVEQLRTAARRSIEFVDVVRYPDADHGFNCDDRSSFHADAAKDAWGRTLLWFDRFIGR